MKSIIKTLLALLLIGMTNVSATFKPSPENTLPMEISIAAPKLYSPINSYVASVIKEFDQIPEDRKKALKKLSLYVQTKVKANELVKLTFICSHNSRRSHMSQIWAQTAAYYYAIKGVETYSGGTEATAFNARAVKAMSKAGFKIDKTGEDKNPMYEVKFTDEMAPVKAFSKVYDADGNPTSNFAAIMTCSQADKNCPFIPGTSLRIAIPYDDPKAFDGTAQEEAKYDERTRQIAREMLYAFSQVK